MFNAHDEPESPYEGACLRYESDSRMRVRVTCLIKVYDDPDLPMRERVVEM